MATEQPKPWRGLRKPGQESKIIDRSKMERELAVTQRAQQEMIAQEAAARGITAPAPQQEPMFSGVSGSRAGFNRESPTATPTGAPPRRETFAEEDARTRREKTMSGAFGERAQAREQARAAKDENLAGRKGLFAEMKAFASNPDAFADKDLSKTDFQSRAEKLGIDNLSFQRGVIRSQGKEFIEPDATPAPAAPLTGRALAESNIATMGQAGAVADYFKRAGAKETAKQSKQIDAAMAAPVNYRSGEARSASASATPSFSSMFRREVDGGAAPMPATSAASFQPTVQSEDGEDFGTFRTRSAPTSLLGAVREDVSGAGGNIRAVGAGARLLAARGVQGAVEGAGNLVTAGARTAGETYLAAKKAEAALKRRAKTLIPGRTGEYLRNR
jgi:hypothetical protein